MTASVQGWERQTRQVDGLLRLVPYSALVGSLVLVVVADDSAPASALPGTLALVAVTAGWMLWMVTLHPGWQPRRAWMVVYFVVLLVLITALIWRSPLFAFFAWTGYLQIPYALHSRWRVIGASGVALLTAVSQTGGFPALRDPANLPEFAIMVVFNVGIACAMTWLNAFTDAQAQRRQRMIGELAEANDKLAAVIAENAGLHAQLLVQAREAGVRDERQRMAGEIHDILAQGLTGIVTQLQAAEQAAERPAQWRRHVGAATALARESLAEARRSVQALSPRPLAAAGLSAALGSVVEEWAAGQPVAAELIVTGEARQLLPEIEVTLLRTAQESLANVARHAAASRVVLTLSFMEDVVTLDVRDDGVGFDPAAPRGTRADGGFGLTAMAQRIHRIAGTVQVESEPGVGTAVSACVPAIVLDAAVTGDPQAGKAPRAADDLPRIGDLPGIGDVPGIGEPLGIGDPLDGDEPRAGDVPRDARCRVVSA